MHAIILCILLTLLAFSNGARILGYVPVPSISHQVPFRPLWKELSLRGHDVTLITTDPINDPRLINLTEINMHSSYDILAKKRSLMIDSGSNAFKVFITLQDILHDIIDFQLQHPDVQKLLTNPNQTFDLVLAEMVATTPLLFAKKFQCPSVGIVSFTPMEFLINYLGIPTHPVLYPDVFLSFEKADTLWDRLTSVTYYLFVQYWTVAHLRPVQNKIIEKHFGQEFGTIEHMTVNISLLLANSNPIYDTPRPLVPTLIHISGIHTEPSNPLPEELRTILDSATNGFIYFSLGSNVKSKYISLKTREVLLDTFSELPYLVLWKFELDELPRKSKNIKISKWFPQTDILDHPNLKLFITQGGLQSIEEAVCRGVPMVGMPYFGDQPKNVEKMMRKGFGIKVDHTTLEKHNFKNTIMEVINNPKYRQKVKQLSELAQDQPISALNQAIWWIEYVIRHKGTAHLRSPLLDVPWYQYLFLDVITFIVVITLVCIYLVIFLIQRIIIIAKKLFTLQKQQKLL